MTPPATFAPPSSSELAELYNQTLLDVKENSIVQGTIVAMSPQEVLIDIGYKSEGAIALSEFPDAKTLKVGDTVEVLVEITEDEHGMVRLSKIKADRERGWERIINNFKETDIIDGRPRARDRRSRAR